MNTLNFSENLIRLRREKGVTQEEVADFVNVTKASVSKWETKQSLPDILLLLQLAAFFDVTVDELLGYKPQLTKEQIKKYYHLLAADFSRLPFDEVMEKCRALIKKYYSCYPFLFQIGILLLNHFMLAGSAEQQAKVLRDAADLCTHILTNSKDTGICNDTVILKAMIDLQCGRTAEVISELEEILNPYRLSSQCDSILIRAYQSAGNTEKADRFTQISMFSHLLSLCGSALEHITNHQDNIDVCLETISRLDELSRIFHLENLHPNTYALFQYQAALLFCKYGRHKEALERLECFTRTIHSGLSSEKLLLLHGDTFFSSIEPWFEEADLGKEAPRDTKIIAASAAQVFSHPAFAPLEQEAAFQKMKNSFHEGGKTE